MRRVGAILPDVNELKRAEQELEAAESNSRFILDSALDAVVTMDAAGLIASWNSKVEETFGWSRSEAVGRRLSETIIFEQHRTAHERGLHHLLKSGERPAFEQAARNHRAASQRPRVSR